MIIYKKKPFDCQMKNMLLLDDGIADGCVYVSKETYDQALSISITYSNDKSRLETLMTPSMPGWRGETGLYDVVAKAFEKMPSPLNTLAIFLGYTAGAGFNWKLEGEELAEQVYGTLHILSQFMDFFMTTTVPADVRSKLTIPKHILGGYRESWTALCSTLADHVVDVEKTEMSTESGSGNQMVEMMTMMKSIVDELKEIKSQPVVMQAPTPTVPTPVAVPVVTPVVATPVTPVTPAVSSTPSTAPASTEEDGENMADMDRIQAIMDRLNSAPIEEVMASSGKKLSGMAESAAKKPDDGSSSSSSSSEPKVMTETVKAEKEIAEKSQQVLNTYDI